MINDDMPSLLSEIYLSWYNQNKSSLIDANQSTLEKIRVGALDFLTENVGKMFQEITDDSSLNAEIINVFAQTFIKHFWLSRIGYADTDDFFIKLSAFLQEKLPVWANFYKQLVVEQKGLATIYGTIKVIGNNNLHFVSAGTTQSNSDTKNQENGNQNTSSNSTTNSSNQGKSDSTTNGTVDRTNTNANNSSSTTASTSSTSGKLALDADTPQDQVKLNNKGNSGDPYNDLTGVYDFKYTSGVHGEFGEEKGTQESTSQNSGSNTEHEESNNQTIANTSSTTTGTEKTDSNTTSDRTSSTNTSSNSSNNTENTQASINDSSTTYDQRTGSLASLAMELSKIANGAYLELFKDAKKAGLFLAVY